MKKIHLLAWVLLLASSTILIQCSPSKKDEATQQGYYELKVYHLTDAEQEVQLDSYLEHALIPALKRNGLKDIGVFKNIPSEQDSTQKVYLLYAFKGLKGFGELGEALSKDSVLQREGQSFINAPYDAPPYERLEVIIMKPFKEMPYLRPSSVTGERDKRVYELRSYESPTEALFQNKVEMFNEGGEVKLFEDVGFNAVFYGEVIAGSRMPNLMYMTTFKDMASRDSLWKVFFDTSKWNELWNDPYYANNVNKADILLFYPTSYSDY